MSRVGDQIPDYKPPCTARTAKPRLVLAKAAVPPVLNPTKPGVLEWLRLATVNQNVDTMFVRLP
jgi:hypothetical protein